MFVGHFAVGLAAKRLVPQRSLGLLVLAPQLLDLLWPIFLLTGLESVRIAPGDTAVTPLDLHDYPYTHSLLGAVFWSVLAGRIVYSVYRDGHFARVFAALVFSHWVLDFVTHRPDLPLYPGSNIYLGLGLWRSMPATLAVELGMFFGSVVIYFRAARAQGRAHPISLSLFLLVLLAFYFGALFGPPPPDPRTLAWGALMGWLFPLWAAWVDRPTAAVSRIELPNAGGPL